MPTIQVPTKSIFATDETLPDDVKALIAAAFDLGLTAQSDIRWKDFPAEARPSDVPGGTLEIKYSRAWLIVRRAVLEATAPKLLVTLPEVPAKDGESTKDHNDRRNREWSKVIQPMREVEGLSWGEISVRVGKPENRIRSCFRATNAKKDVGLRIGKGGRFAYSDPELYLEHRKAEGAMIPVEVRSKPKVEDLLNGRNAEGQLVTFQRAVAKAQARVEAKEERAKRVAPAKATPAKPKPAAKKTA